MFWKHFAHSASGVPWHVSYRCWTRCSHDGFRQFVPQRRPRWGQVSFPFLQLLSFPSSFLLLAPWNVANENSWNKDLAGQRGVAMGGEFKKKGVNVLLGPVVGPAWRVATSGRNWEGFAADPYLSGSLAAETVRGVQSENVITSVKVSNIIYALPDHL